MAHYVSTLSSYMQESYRIAFDKHILPTLGQIPLTKCDFSYFLAAPKEGKERRIVLAANVMQVLHEQQVLQRHMAKIAEPVWENFWGLVRNHLAGKQR